MKDRKDELIISAYGSHNAAISMYYKGQFTIIEVERWIGHKNIGLCNYMPVNNFQLVFDEIVDYLLSTTDRSDVDTYIAGYMDHIKPKFKFTRSFACAHHEAHAATALYQSPYEDALVVTFDGGGDGGYFNVYEASRKKGITQIAKLDQDLGYPYMILADYLEDIKKESLSIANLVYAGKLMGLCSYGNVREEWLPHFMKYYRKFNYVGSSYIGGGETRFDAITALFNDLGIDFDFESSRFSGQLAWDIAATTQRAFENYFYELASPYLNEYPHMPLCLAGGCALNVLLNTRLADERDGKVFVPPNTNDCGISVGGILYYLAPEYQVDVTYSGTPVLDKNKFCEYVESGEYEVFTGVTLSELGQFIAEGNIVGVVNGSSEHGSRALGNRSILCNPIEGMKDTLNAKVKNREWYRPFAPLVRLEDATKYFDYLGYDSRHMTFVAPVREEWRDTLPAITHEDYTGRLQTVTRSQNEFIHTLIGEFEKHAGHGVLLNTSFNVNGKPILTTLADAFHILKTTQLDAVYYNDCLFTRRGDGKSFKNLRENGTSDLDADMISGFGIIFTTSANDPGSLSAAVSKAHSIANTLGVERTGLIHFGDIDLSSIDFGDTVSLPLSDRNFYYHNEITKVLPDVTNYKQSYDILRPLWIKDFMADNTLKTKKSAIIDLDTFEDSCMKVLGFILKSFKDEAETFVFSDEDTSGISGKLMALLSDKYPTPPTTFPRQFALIALTSNMEETLRHYEGMLLWKMRENVVFTERELWTLSLQELPYKYKEFDL